ncbi:MAG: DUF3307 domain-containing protein [Pseudomonadota bacterium]
MTIEALLALAALLFVKHLIADGPLQSDAQAANKGVWMHPDGLLHSGIHVAGTALCLSVWALFFGVEVPLGVGLGLLIGEFIAHYLIDISKCRIDARVDWASRGVDEQGRPVLQIRHKFFFFLFLADQTLHSLTYVAMLYALAVA